MNTTDKSTLTICLNRKDISLISEVSDSIVKYMRQYYSTIEYMSQGYKETVAYTFARWLTIDDDGCIILWYEKPTYRIKVADTATCSEYFWARGIDKYYINIGFNANVLWTTHGNYKDIVVTVDVQLT